MAANVADSVVLDHTWVVERFVRHYLRQAPAAADLREAGMLGLVEAAGRWTPERGVAFGTFAWSWVKGHVLSELRRAHVVALSDHAVRCAKAKGEQIAGTVSLGLDDESQSVGVEAVQERSVDCERRAAAVRRAVSGLGPLERCYAGHAADGLRPGEIIEAMRISSTTAAELRASVRATLTAELARLVAS